MHDPFQGHRYRTSRISIIRSIIHNRNLICGFPRHCRMNEQQPPHAMSSSTDSSGYGSSSNSSPQATSSANSSTCSQLISPPLGLSSRSLHDSELSDFESYLIQSSLPVVILKLDREGGDHTRPALTSFLENKSFRSISPGATFYESCQEPVKIKAELLNRLLDHCEEEKKPGQDKMTMEIEMLFRGDTKVRVNWEIQIRRTSSTSSEREFSLILTAPAPPSSLSVLSPTPLTDPLVQLPSSEDQADRNTTSSPSHETDLPLVCFRRLAEREPVSLFWCNASFEPVWVNAVWRTSTGCTSPNLDIDDMVHPDDLDELKAWRKRLVEEEIDGDTEFRWKPEKESWCYMVAR
jgi:hypothetical protein